MNITLKTKKLYEVVNERGLIEIHYRRYKIGFKSKTQSSLILFYCEDYCEILTYAEIIFNIF